MERNHFHLALETRKATLVDGDLVENVIRSSTSKERSLVWLFGFLHWFDGRAVLLAIGLSLATSLPSWSTLADRREDYFFDVTLTSTASGYTRVLWDNGHGFNEHDSSAQPLRIEHRPVTYRYLLPYGRLVGLRFAPIDRPGEITLTEARVVGADGRLIRRFKAADFSAGRGYASFRRDGETIAATALDPAQEGYIDVKLTAPLRLDVSWRAAWRAFAPLGLIALGIGLVLASRLGAAISAWVERLVRSGETRPCVTILLVAAGAVLWQTHPVVFEGRSFVSPANGSLMLYGDLPTLPGSKQAVYEDGMGSDTGAMLFQHLYYPMLERTALLHDHELPLWNRSSLCGLPLLGQGQSMAGDPFNLITILADGASWAWDIRFVIARWLLATGLALAAWQYTRHLPAALLTAVGASFLGFFTYRLDHPANFSLAYAPWLLVAWLGLVQARTFRREFWAVGLLLVAHLIEFCSGTVKESVVLIGMLDFAGVGLLLLSPESAGRRWRRLGLAAVAGGLFVLLAAPFWWSFLDSLRHSFTGYDVPHAEPLAWRELIGLFDDIFYRQNSAEEWVVAPSLNFLFLAGLLIWALRRSAWTRIDAALAIAAALSFGIGFGVVPPRWVEAVPFLGNINHIGNEFSCVLLIILVPLAANGFKVAASVAEGRSWWSLCGGVVVALGVLIGAWYASPLRVGLSPFAFGYVLELAAGLAGLALGLRWRAVGRSLAGWRVACVLAIPLLLWRHGQFGRSPFNHYVFVPGERVDVHAASAAVRAVGEARSEPDRVVGFGTNLFPGYPAALGWESLYGVDALRNRYYQELATSLHLERVWRWEEPDREADAGKLGAARDVLNVRYSLTDHSAEARTLPGLTRVHVADLDVYESKTAWPRAFFTDRLAHYDSVDDFARMIDDGDRRPFAAVQADQTGIPALGTELLTRTIRPAAGYHLTANTTRFTVDAPTAGIAVLTEAFYPGDFRVTLDGRAVPYFRVNHAFKGVAIPAPGRHEIAMTYWPEHFTAALALSALGLILLGLSAGYLARATRRAGAD